MVFVLGGGFYVNFNIFKINLKYIIDHKTEFIEIDELTFLRSSKLNIITHLLNDKR